MCPPKGIWLFVLGLLACFSHRALAGEGLTLVADGRTEFQIVLGEEAIPSERYAAEKLAHFLNEISGAAFPIITDENPLPDHAIMVGPNRWLAALGVNPEELRLDEEAYLIQTTGEHLLIVGGRPRGTLYGVYGFLEDRLGCLVVCTG